VILKAFSIILFVKNTSGSQLLGLLSLKEIRTILDFWQSFENSQEKLENPPISKIHILLKIKYFLIIIFIKESWYSEVFFTKRII